MNNFYDNFNYSRKNQPNSKMLMIFNQKREYIKDGTHVSFIEGPDDLKFYKNISCNKNLRETEKSNYIYSNNEEHEVKGKNGVLIMYNYIYNKFPTYLDKCIFIVDHDYNGLKGYNVLDENAIKITESYAFENYFLEEKNIEKIFNYFNIQDDLENFKTMLKKYIYEVSNFVRLKSTITNNKQIHISNLYSNKEIFKFDFSNSKFYNIEYLVKETNNMFNAIKNNNKAYNYYLFESKNFMNSSRWVRGHDIYNFLYEYLKQKHNNDLKLESTYIDIVKKLDIKLVVKDGLGNILD